MPGSGLEPGKHCALGVAGGTSPSPAAITRASMSVSPPPASRSCGWAPAVPAAPSAIEVITSVVARLTRRDIILPPVARRRAWLLFPALLLALAAPAEAHVFWANKYEEAIGRANLDASGTDQAFISVGPPMSHPVGLAVDDSHVYWSAFEETDAVGRARLDGSGVEAAFVPGAADPVGVAVDAEHLYWANSATGTIGRADLDGGSPNQSFISTGGTPYGLAVSTTHVYWTDFGAGTIGRAAIDGGGADAGFLTVGGGPTAVAANATHLYWADDRNGTDASADVIGRAELGGGGANPSSSRAR